MLAGRVGSPQLILPGPRKMSLYQLRRTLPRGLLKTYPPRWPALGMRPIPTLPRLRVKIKAVTTTGPACPALPPSPPCPHLPLPLPLLHVAQRLLCALPVPLLGPAPVPLHLLCLLPGSLSPRCPHGSLPPPGLCSEVTSMRPPSHLVKLHHLPLPFALPSVPLAFTTSWRFMFYLFFNCASGLSHWSGSSIRTGIFICFV